MIHKTTRSILSVLLAVLLLVTSIPLTPAFAGGGGAVSPQSANSERGGLEQDGDGTAGNPYKIATANDLREFAQRVNNGQIRADAYAVLTDNIDLNPGFTFKEDGSYSGPDREEPHQWIPIGNEEHLYTGTFNGDGHTISGLYINNSDNYQGLFGYVGTGGTVKVLTVSGNVSGDWHVGGVVGYNDGGTVTNCAFTGSVSGNNYVGGVVGYSSGGSSDSASVTNCYNTGSVTSSGSPVGGVVGYNSGIVTNCYNTGSVTGTNDSVGGVVGDNGGTVENCYNTGSVKGDWYVGGVVGYNGGNVENCYNTGKVTGTRIDDYVGGVGGVVGYNISGSVTGCYFLKDTAASGIGNGGGGATPLSAEAFESQDNFTSWDFDNTWKIESIFGRPTLKDNAEIGGTANNPYKIFTATQLAAFRDLVNDENDQTADPDAHAKLMNDINLSSVCGVNAGESGQSVSWTPIGSISNEYTGTFNGNGKTISGLYINTTSYEDQGLFGYLSGTVQNLSVSGSVSGDWHVGGVVGYNNGGTVTGCIFSGSGSVSGSYHVGGIVGQNRGSVENCYNTGAVSGPDSGYSNVVGGVVGYNDSGANVENCYNTGTVSGPDSGSGNFVGGVVGYNYHGTSVENCYNTGAVSGPDSGSGDWYVGGVVGYNRGSVTNCYNTDSVTVTGSGSRVGGVVGYNSSGIVTNCYFLKTADVNKNLSGIGFGGEGQEAIQKTADAFHSGDVAYLLEQKVADSDKPVWGQRIGEDDFPVLFADPNKTVYQVKINLKDSADSSDTLRYTNSDLQALTPTREGYTFDGWYDNQECTGEAVTTITDTTATLYAKWTPNTYTVTLHTNDGTIAEGEKLTSYTYGVGAKLPTENEITKTGYTFAGWYESANFSGDSVAAIGKDAIGDKAYYANWTANEYDVTLNTDGGTIAEGQNVTSYIYGVGAKLPTENEITKTGYIFAGWYNNADLTGDPVTEISKTDINDKAYWAKWEEVENPEPTPTPTPDPTPSGPSTGDSTGWDDIRDELENAENGDQITIDMGDETKVPAEIFESLAGKDVEISFDLGDVQWTVNGADIPTDTDFTDLDLGVSLGTSGIPVNVINTITGEVGTVQITLAHDGEFGFTMTLTAPLGKENAGYWANLYHYDEDAEALNFEAAAKIDEDGSVTIPFSHASQYAIVIDTHSHATVDVSDLFSDIAPDAWYKDAVQYAYDNGLMTGVSDTEFAPEATTTRAMIVSILARLEGVESAEAAGFADVNDEWYATAVNWAANVGVVNGYEDNTFKPNTAITREQLAAILMNYAAYKGEDVSNRADLATYTDQPSTWAEETMQWAVAEGLISGVTNDQLQPQGNATRAQVAAILQRFLDK